MKVTEKLLFNKNWEDFYFFRVKPVFTIQNSSND